MTVNSCYLVASASNFAVEADKWDALGVHGGCRRGRAMVRRTTGAVARPRTGHHMSTLIDTQILGACGHAALRHCESERSEGSAGGEAARACGHASHGVWLRLFPEGSGIGWSRFGCF